MQNVTLYYREGASDKVYQAAIVPKDNLFLVNFAYGRRGATLNTGTKTASPVDQPTAVRLFDRLVREKKAKGYTEGPDGTPYQHTERATQVTGILPQLLNPMPDGDLQVYLDDPNYCMQEKFDGKRLLLLKNSGQIQGINRRGLNTGVPQTVVSAAQHIPGDWLMDGEAVGDNYHVFDLLQLGGQNLRSLGYGQRFARLQELFRLIEMPRMGVVTSLMTGRTKRQYFNLLQKDNREGVVFKRLDAPHTTGRPASGGSQLKHKFYATASCLVVAINDKKRSVSLALSEGDTSVSAGNVTIPPNVAIPRVGAVLEIRYLHAFLQSGALYQPVYLHERRDVLPSECRTSQLKYRATPSEDDEP